MSRELLFEIGVEEIPSAALYDAIAQLKASAERALREARLGFGEVETFGSPRRLVLRVKGLAEVQADENRRVKGPAARAAFDADGAPTKALEGFARGKGVEVASLVRDTDESGGEYMFAVIENTGAPAAEVLPATLASLAQGLAWPKSQRWGSGSDRFIRPVRWMLALLGGDVVPVSFAGLVAGGSTRGHRFLGPVDAIAIADASEYDTAARRGSFVYDQAERARLIREGIAAVEESHGVKAVVPERTFAEVVNLVEWPTAALGRFDESFLSLPREVIETAMTKHQRYFPVEDAAGSLTNGFVVVHNGDPARTEQIVAGHERVIRARLADAAFFYREDLSSSMEDWVGGLGVITFHEKLGTLAAKTARVERLVARLADAHGADPGAAAEAGRAAHLAKADLVSHVVIEFPLLQGVMGSYYALASNEGPAVARAITEHYQPRFAGDVLPSSVAGMLVSAADKLDTIAGIFAVGQAPTGSADPYALRRAAIGVLAMILDGGLRLTLDTAVEAALEGYEGIAGPGTDTAVRVFVKGRLEVMLRDRGLAHDVVAAVMAVRPEDPADVLARAKALEALRSTDVGRDLLVACKRATNLADRREGDVPDPGLMGPVESALFDAVTSAEAQVHTLVATRRYDDAVGLLAGLRGPVDAFFDGVLVMDEDAAVRANRLRLLNRVADLFAGFADLAQLEG
ncbi:MAG: glycine--tRNA ligase subunit beta [Coriobacteriia bacterium]